MKLGACDYLVRRNDEQATFRQARLLDLEGIEFFVGRAELSQGLQSPRLKRIQQAAAASGLAVPSLCLVEHNEGGLGSRDPAAVERAREDIRNAIAWAAELQSQVILVPFFFKGDLPDQASFDRAVAGFRELCPLAAQRGISLCYEGTFPAARIREMAGRVGSPAFGCYFDLANVVWRGMDAATEIRALGKLIRQIHMKDSRVGPGDVQPGLGRVDYDEAARALAEIGYDGWIVLETPGQPTVSRDISFTRLKFPMLRRKTPWPQFGSFTWDFQRGQIDHMIGAFHELGLSSVQLSGPLLEECLEDAARAEALADKLERNGTTVVGLGGYRNLVAPEPARRKANLDHLARCLEVARLFPFPVVATETGTLHPESDWTAVPENQEQPAWDALCAAMDRLLPVAEKNGSVLALEGYVNNVVAHAGQVQGLLDRYPTRNLQLVLDPYNYVSSHLLPAVDRVTASFLDRFEHRFVIAHLKDVGKDGAEKDTPAFGKGVFPQKLYLEFLRSRRPDMPLIIEHITWPEIPQAIRLCRELAAGKA